MSQRAKLNGPTTVGAGYGCHILTKSFL